jgi:hypothetical protein
MRIAYITPGSGKRFYCENCIRDAALINAMRDLGHDAVGIPMYLPLQAAPEGRARRPPVFFGGINVYLQQRFRLFRRTPRWIDRLFDWHLLLALAGRAGSLTASPALAETTISVLKGPRGHQAKELERLLGYLERPDNRPQAVCLSNVLLAGLAPAIKARIGAAVVCLLHDEEGFLEAMGRPHSKRAWEMLAENARSIDAFAAFSDPYAETMRRRLGLGPGQPVVIRPEPAVPPAAGRVPGRFDPPSFSKFNITDTARQLLELCRAAAGNAGGTADA